MTSFLIIGTGRIATHFSHYLKWYGMAVDTYHYHQNKSLLIEKISKADAILLAVPDGAIHATYEAIAPLEKPVFHFSGCIYHPAIIGMHPLMTFAHELYPIETYCSVPFIVDTSVTTFKKHFPFLQNPIFPIEPHQKPLYHALCVMAGNFPMLLWSLIFKEFSQLNLSPSVLAPYLQQSLANSLSHPTLSLTGPLVRNDHKTIAEHKNSLQNSALRKLYEQFEAVYQAMTPQDES